MATEHAQSITCVDVSLLCNSCGVLSLCQANYVVQLILISKCVCVLCVSMCIAVLHGCGSNCLTIYT